MDSHRSHENNLNEQKPPAVFASKEMLYPCADSFSP